MFLIEVHRMNRWVPWDIADKPLAQVLQAPPVDNHHRPFHPNEWRARRIHATSRSHYEAEIRQIWQPD